MAQQNNIAQQLNDLLVTRNFHPDMLDAQGKVCDSEDAKTFTFDYISGAGKNYGTMVVILDSDNDLKAFYGDNLGRTMEGDDKQEFFDFQQHLSQFANAHRWTYTAKDLGQLKHTMQGLAAIKEGLFEGYYGTRRISYAGEPTEARLMIRHNRNLGETDARFRYVESIFIETADGERYRLPFTNLAGGRAMLEHVRQGGKPYDVRGNHICEMITELKVLTRFNRASQGRVVEGITQGVVQGAQTYYKSLRENIKRMAGSRGYSAYFESWHPADITEQDQLVEDIKTLFVEQTIDDRIEQALPLLAKIQRGREMKEADIFENWVNSVTESHWNLPETPEQLNKLKTLMSSELIVGPDGTNAKEQLRDIIGDDDLFNRIEDLAAQDPDANLWDDTEVQDILQALGIQMPDNSAPDMDAQPQQAMAEGTGTGEYSRVLTALGLYYPRLSMEELNTPGYHKVIANKAGVPVEYAADIINDFANPKDYWSDDENDEQGVAEAAKWRDPRYQGKTFDYDDSYEGPHDTKTSKISLDRAGMRQINTFDPLEYKAREKQATGRLTPQDVKYATAKNFGKEKQQQLDYDRSRKAEQGMAEADNVSTFESLQRMRHLSGIPLAENVMNDHTGSTMNHIMNTYQRDIRDFVQGGDMSDHLYQALYDYYYDDMPYGVKKARTGDPYEWIGDRFAQDIGSQDMIDEAEGEFPPPSDPSKYPEVSATQPLPADALSTGQLTIRPTPTTSPAAGPVVGASTNPAVQQAVKDATGGQFVPKSAPPPAAAPAADTGPTAGGVPSTLPAGVNRLQMNKPAPAPAPAPAAPAPAAPTDTTNTLKNNVLPSGATTRSLAKPAPVEEDQARSQAMRKMPSGGYPVADKTMPTAANRAVASLDLSKQQTEPDPLDAMKTAAGLPTIAPRTVKSVDLIKNPELVIDEPQWDYKDSQPAITSTSSDTQAQKDRILRLAALDQMTQDQRDRITHMQQQMPDTTPGNTTGASGYYDSNGMLHIDMSAGLEESAPLEECNYTMEDQYCPVHGLKECWLEEMNLSILATGSQLIEDLDEGLLGSLANVATKYGPKIAAPVSAALAGIGLGSVIDKSLPSDNSFSDSVRASINNVDKIKGTGSTQGSSFKDPFDGPFARPVDEGGMPGMGAAIRGAGELGGKAANAVKSLFKAEPEIGAAIKYPEGHPDFPLLQAARDREQGSMKVWNKRYPDTPWTPQSDEDLLKSFNHDLNVQKGFSQNSRDAMPNDTSPTGYTRAQKSKGAAFDAEKSMQGNQDLFKNAYGIDEDMTDVGDVVGQAARSARDYLGKTADNISEPIGNFFKGVKQGYNGKASEKPKGQAHAGQRGYDYSDEEPVAMPVRSPDITTRDLPGDSMDESGRSLNYESREGDALLARIKSLALIR